MATMRGSSHMEELGEWEAGAFCEPFAFPLALWRRGWRRAGEEEGFAFVFCFCFGFGVREGFGFSDSKTIGGARRGGASAAWTFPLTTAAQDMVSVEDKVGYQALPLRFCTGMDFGIARTSRLLLLLLVCKKSFRFCFWLFCFGWR